MYFCKRWRLRLGPCGGQSYAVGRARSLSDCKVRVLNAPYHEVLVIRRSRNGNMDFTTLGALAVAEGTRITQDERKRRQDEL